MDELGRRLEALHSVCTTGRRLEALHSVMHYRPQVGGSAQCHALQAAGDVASHY